MKRWKTEYEAIQIPEGLKEGVEDSIKRAKKEKRKMKKKRIYKICGSAAAVLAVLLILPNTSASVAAAMQSMPVLGGLFRVVTVREYHVEEDRNMADVKVPEIVPEETDNEKETSEQAKKTAEEINLDIQQVTETLINEFKENMSAEGHQDITINSQVLTDDERWFSLDLLLYQAAGSGYEQHRHYTIDKTTGKKAQLSDFYGEDYIAVISEEVKRQMREQMEADENLIYWLDEEEPVQNFQEIAEDQDFYVNAGGRVVICFNEYEVAPGYMGCVEFEMPEEF